ncbi:MAG: SPOR domain-containing protein [Psychromonas sp.]
MAPINRRKPARVTPKKRVVRKPAAVKNRGRVPYIAVLAALLIIGFISYFVFWVQKPQTDEIVKKPAQKEESLPEMPEPKWDYENKLKTKIVQVDIPEETAVTEPYQMQCGSFRRQGDAESLKVRIAFQGLNSEVRKTGNWYRVILGPYERKRTAEKDRHKLQRAKVNDCQIWFWR